MVWQAKICKGKKFRRGWAWVQTRKKNTWNNSFSLLYLIIVCLFGFENQMKWHHCFQLHEARTLFVWLSNYFLTDDLLAMWNDHFRPGPHYAGNFWKRNYRYHQSLWICVSGSKTQTGKWYVYLSIIFKKLRYQIVFCTKMQSHGFQIPLVGKVFSKSFLFGMDWCE